MTIADLSSVSDYTGMKVTVMGLGTFGGGVAATRFLAQRGAVVTVTDLRPEVELQDSLQQLDDVPIAGIFAGAHPDTAFTGTQLLVVNPAVKPGNVIVEQFRNRGAIITSEIGLFLHHNPASVVAVTGSNGKSTTAALTCQLLEQHVAAHGNSVWLGGNIGHSLLPSLTDIQSDDIVVLELSSFQLYALASSGFAPRVGVVTNFSPNHLDWHPTLEHYRTAKQIMLRRQGQHDVAVLPPDLNDAADGWRVRGQCLRFGTSDDGEDGAFLEHGSLILRRGHIEDAVRINQPSQLPGAHNGRNIAAAACAAWSMGADVNHFDAALAKYEPLPHRLQLVADGRGLRFYNDSLATTPESAIAALRSFSTPCVIIAGGYDKGSDLRAFAEAIHAKTVAAVLIGDTANSLAQHLSSLSSAEQQFHLDVAKDFEDAFSLAVAVAPQGSIVLLSPGCASYDWFRDFRERGDRFRNLALQWLQ
jgi:UDP-N-acetylmuramoylalanine--D-glutamate ligase